jgi:phosphoglycerate dehydrogenase-like enzyme
VSARPKIVVLDDYERSMRREADWSAVDRLADVTVQHEKLRGDALLAAIGDADAIALVRDRTPFKADLLAKLPKLRYFVFTGMRNTQMDAQAFAGRGIPVSNTGKDPGKDGTSEHTWALILAAAKRLENQVSLVRAGQWRDGGALSVILRGERLGLVGFGEIGQRVGRVGEAFGMEVVTWSPHMTPERAAAGGAKSVSLEELLSTSKVVSLHLVPAESTRRLLDAGRMAAMRPDSILVNTSRSALVDMDALVAALDAGRPGTAAIDVFDEEPLPEGFALARHPRAVLTPHTGFVSQQVYRQFAGGMVECLTAWLEGGPLVRVVPPQAPLP